MTKDRSHIINFIIEQHKLKSYLEIGLLHGRNFRKIKVEHKESVDCNPKCNATYSMRSDCFFANYRNLRRKKTYDVVLIDGSHLSEDAGSDAFYSLHYLNPKYIIMHDCNPVEYEHQIRQVPTDLRPWNGDVWTAWICLRKTLKSLPMFVVDIDQGCGVIYNKEIVQSEFATEGEITWDTFQENRNEWLNLKSFEYFEDFVMEQANGIL